MGKDRGKKWENLVKRAVQRCSRWTFNFNNIGKMAKGSVESTKPGDRIHCWKGRSVLIEAKESHGTSISFSQVKLHQEHHLYLHAQDEGLSVVAISHVKGNKRRAWLIHYSDWAHLKATIGRKSIPFATIPDQLVEIHRRGFPGMGREWDLAAGYEALLTRTPAPLAKFSPVTMRGMT